MVQFRGIIHPEPQGGPTSIRRARTGRPSIVPAPDVAIPPAWEDAWLGFELSMLSQDRSAGTIKNRRSTFTILARHAAAAEIGDPALVTKSWLQRYMVRQIAERKNSGAANHYQGIKSFWTWYAAEHETASPVKGIPRPGGEAPSPAVLGAAQLEAVLTACGKSWMGLRNRAILLLMIESGLRRMEIIGLDLDDIDLKARTAVVRRGKGGKARVAVFGALTAEALHRYIRVRNTETRHGPELFTSLRRDRMSLSGISQTLSRIGEAAGVPGLRPHLFRHAWAHYSLSAGMQEHDLMELAGWTTTKQIGRYGKALAQQRAIAAGRAVQVGQIIKGK